MDKLTSMKVFCRVVMRENFSQAARELRLSPAMITKHVAGLEEELGIRLLNRTTRRVSTTEAGRRYFELCQQLLHDIDEAEASLTELGSKPRGQLRIAAPVDFGVLCLAPAIAAYLQTYPEIQIDIHYQDNKVNLIDEGYDLAIRIGALDDSNLIAQRVLPYPMVCCASPDYLKQHGTPRTPQDLKSHNCLTYAYSSSNNEWVFSKNNERFAIRVSGRLNANNGRAMVATAVQGVGIIMKPYFMIQDHIPNGELVPILTDYHSQAATVYAVYPHRQFLPAKISSFIDFIRHYFDQNNPMAGKGG